MLNFGRMNMLQICFWFLLTWKNTWEHFQNDLRTKNRFFLQPKLSQGVKWGSSRNFCIFSSSQVIFKRLRKWLVDEFKKLRNALQTLRWTPKNILHIFKNVVRRLEVNIEPFQWPICWVKAGSQLRVISPIAGSQNCGWFFEYSKSFRELNFGRMNKLQICVWFLLT